MGKRLTRQPLLWTLAQVGCKFDPWITSPASLITGNMGTHLIITSSFDVPPMAGWLYSMCTDIHICIHTNIYVCTYIFSGRSVASLLSAGCSLMGWVWEPEQKFTHHRQGQAHPSPLLHSASALQIRRQTGNESSCALVNELIILHHHCQFCFCSSWSQHLSGSGCNFRVATRTFQEDVFLDKCKVRKYFSTQLGFSFSPLF